MNRISHLIFAAALSITAYGQSSPDLQTRLKGLDSFLTQEMRDADIPSLAVAVTRNGEVVYTKGFGQARPGVPADQDTLFALASISKGLTAMGIMELVEQGRIDPAQTVRSYLPGFNTGDPRSDQITVAQLLSHTSGFSTRDGREVLSRSDRDTIPAMLECLKSVRLCAAPGRVFQYSNWNYIIAGAIIQAVSGKDYAAYMRTEVFDPMGMTRTRVAIGKYGVDGAAIGSRSFLGFTLRGAVALPAGVAPAGGVFSCARDMGSYLATLQKDGVTPFGAPILGASAMAALTTPHAPARRYGYGWGLTKDAIYHAGDNAEFHGDVYIQRQGAERWGIAVLCGKNDPLAETLDPEGSFQMRIVPGVLGILTHGDAQLPPPRTGTRCILMLFATLLLAVAAGCSVAGLRRWTRERPGAWRVMLAVLLHLCLPLAILAVVPAITDSSWSLLRVWAPDAGWILGGFAVLELAVGLVKGVVWIFRPRAPKA